MHSKKISENLLRRINHRFLKLYKLQIDSVENNRASGVFIRNSKCAVQNNSFADGASQRIYVYTYEDNKFNAVLKEIFGGSDMGNHADYQERYENIGFTGTANYFAENRNPYFTHGLNIAILEEDAERICEVLITNNLRSLDLSTTSYLQNEVMYIQTNVYSDIDK